MDVCYIKNWKLKKREWIKNFFYVLTYFDSILSRNKVRKKYATHFWVKLYYQLTMYFHNRKRTVCVKYKDY